MRLVGYFGQRAQVDGRRPLVHIAHTNAMKGRIRRPPPSAAAVGGRGRPLLLRLLLLVGALLQVGRLLVSVIRLG